MEHFLIDLGLIIENAIWSVLLYGIPLLIGTVFFYKWRKSNPIRAKGAINAGIIVSTIIIAISFSVKVLNILTPL